VVVAEAADDHASIPATLRTLFAPQAAPLTVRGAWSAPFHGCLTLPTPRTGEHLSDLSAHAAPAGPAIAASAELPAGPDAVPDIPPDATFPHYYDDFVS
jgi:phospholipase C